MPIDDLHALDRTERSGFEHPDQLQIPGAGGARIPEQLREQLAGAHPAERLERRRARAHEQNGAPQAAAGHGTRHRRDLPARRRREHRPRDPHLAQVERSHPDRMHGRTQRRGHDMDGRAEVLEHGRRGPFAAKLFCVCGQGGCERDAATHDPRVRQPLARGQLYLRHGGDARLACECAQCERRARPAAHAAAAARSSTASSASAARTRAGGSEMSKVSAAAATASAMPARSPPFVTKRQGGSPSRS